MKYCRQCGAPLEDQVTFCPSCGASLSNGSGNGYSPNPGYSPNSGYNQNPNGNYTPPAPVYNSNGGRYPQQNYGGGYQQPGYGGDPGGVLYTLTDKMRTSATIWTVIGIMQLIVSIPCMCFGYGFVTLFLAIWNLVQASKERKNAAYFQQNPAGIVNYFEAQGTILVVFLVLNLLGGVLFGVIGSIYDLTIRSFALSHRNELLQLERSGSKNNGGHNIYY